MKTFKSSQTYSKVAVFGSHKITSRLYFNVFLYVFYNLTYKCHPSFMHSMDLMYSFTGFFTVNRNIRPFFSTLFFSRISSSVLTCHFNNAAFSPTFVSCSSLKPQVETLPLMNNGFNEFGCTTSTGTLNNNISERIDKGTSKWKLKGKRNSRHLNKVKNRNKYGNKGGFNVSMDGDEPLPSNEKILPFRNSRLALHPKYQTRDLPGRNSWADSNLYDVDIEVKANYKPQHVPLVSLMSKLNGKAIVGHPLTVEVLADGCCNDMLRNLSWELGGEPPTENVQEGGERISAKKLKLRRVCSRGKARNLRKSGMLSKKTRKLSSLTGIQKQKKEESRPVVERQCPPIACIPLKVVFSRLNEAVKVSPRP